MYFRVTISWRSTQLKTVIRKVSKATSGGKYFLSDKPSHVDPPLGIKSLPKLLKIIAENKQVVEQAGIQRDSVASAFAGELNQ